VVAALSATACLVPDLKNPNFGEVAKAVGLWGHMVSKAGELEEPVQTWLAQPGPPLLHVKVKPTQLVTPPSPFVSPEAVVGMAVYSAKALLHGKDGNVWEMMAENIP
jgi:pyruvate dehydrogenase (quinone)